MLTVGGAETPVTLHARRLPDPEPGPSDPGHRRVRPHHDPDARAAAHGRPPRRDRGRADLHPALITTSGSAPRERAGRGGRVPSSATAARSARDSPGGPDVQHAGLAVQPPGRPQHPVHQHRRPVVLARRTAPAAPAGTIRPRSACPSSTLSYSGRNRAGAGTSGSGRGRVRQVEQLPPVLGPVRYAARGRSRSTTSASRVSPDQFCTSATRGRPERGQVAQHQPVRRGSARERPPSQASASPCRARPAAAPDPARRQLHQRHQRAGGLGQRDLRSRSGQRSRSSRPARRTSAAAADQLRAAAASAAWSTPASRRRRPSGPSAPARAAAPAAAPRSRPR